ncbi:hypothetical protein DBV05_g4800 [Lasiodiplodia theobromae]|uniref:N-acetylgalactosaminide beta-1,3-galactosyltransferase n=1 Tax=Lasiodiplodia theobromae TaxID=45133 RepID=A0A5N5DFT1_9PEZI|nr:hypothetical protein DBV05_g4800 [Lasiodiplodia theobromae]
MRGLQGAQSSRKAPFVVTAAACLLLSVLILRSYVEHVNFRATIGSNFHSGGNQTGCPSSLPGNAGSDVLLVMKTGATEAHAKLPIHFNTTLRCVPHYVLFSDVDEEVDGHHVHDTLDSVADSVKTANAEDFALYRLQQELHAQGVNLGKIITNSSEMRSKAWVLDKWKFLPLMEKALAAAPGPHTKWFVFVEADTAFVWSNLLRWLKWFDPEKPWYIGGQTWAGGSAFAHGGTGFILSRAALERLVDHLAQHPNVYPSLTADNFAGDLVLALALKSVDVPLTMGFPILQGETPYKLDYTEFHWCHPVVTWHHMSPGWVEKMWEFEQEFLRRVESNHGGDWMRGRHQEGVEEAQRKEWDMVMRHYHVFEEFVAPYVRVSEKANWNNFSPDILQPAMVKELGQETGKEGCKKACEKLERCIQWSWVKDRGDGVCRTAEVMRRGEVPDETDWNGVEMTSGWIVERVDEFMRRMEGCRKGNWIMGP